MASAAPPLIAYRSMAPMMGVAHSNSARWASRQIVEKFASHSGSGKSLNAAKSRPEQKLPPAPLSTMACTSSSRSSRRIPSASPRPSGPTMAFLRPGRFNTTSPHPLPPSWLCLKTKTSSLSGNRLFICLPLFRSTSIYQPPAGPFQKPPGAKYVHSTATPR